MSPRNKLLAMNQYKGVDTDAAAEYADSVQLIQMLFSALLDSISDADGHIQRGDLAKKGESIFRLCVGKPSANVTDRVERCLARKYVKRSA